MWKYKKVYNTCKYNLNKQHIALNAVYYLLVYFFCDIISFWHYVHGLVFNFIPLFYLLLGTLNI